HLDTSLPASGVTAQSRIELFGDAIAGAPPLANLAIRTSHQIEAAWEPVEWSAAKMLNRLTLGGGWKTADPRNRWTTPSDLNLITASGVTAAVVEFNTPLDSRQRIGSVHLFA